ncbi:hypothetical protein GH816_06280 [Betaproteobacteria bacterium LSUCC0115]|nr:hypothetical protein [Burkholderiales bacterium LSUCC0115]
MAIRAGTNLLSMFGARSLASNSQGLATSVERLSSGLRINRAKDDAAGLGISEKIKSQVTALNQGIRNANDAISMVQTAEGSLSEVSTILQRMKELSVQNRNDSLSTKQRKAISDELVSLKSEINAIADRTTFNHLSLLKNAIGPPRLSDEVVGVANGVDSLRPGSVLANGLKVTEVGVDTAEIGRYELTVGSPGTPISVSSHVTAKSDPTEGRIPNPAPPQFTNNDFENSGSVTTSTALVQVNGPAGATTTVTVQSIPGWDVYLQQVKLGTTEIGGFVSPSVTNNPGTIPPNGDENTPGSATYSAGFASTVTAAAEGVSAVLNSNMTTAVGYDVVHGPYLISTGTVDLQAGDEISFKWRANYVSDDFDVYGYLLNTSDGSTIELLKATGTRTSDVVPGTVNGTFATADPVTVLAGQEGNYKFVFVSGTYDKSGFRGAGAQMVIDDVNVTFAARAGETQVYTGGTTTAAKLTVSGEWEAGDEILYSVKGDTSTVTTLTYVVTAENFTKNNDGSGGAIDPDSDLARQNIAQSIADQYGDLTTSSPTSSAASGIVTFAGASVTITAEQLNRPLLQRDVTFSQADLAAGNKLTLSVGGRDYSVITSQGMTASSVAGIFEEKLSKDYPGSISVSDETLTFQPGSQTSDAEISLTVQTPSQFQAAASFASYVDNPSDVAQADRRIVINDRDLIPGRELAVSIGSPGTATTYRVRVGTGDTSSTVAERLEALIDDNMGSAIGPSSGSTVVSNVITINAATGFGMSNISLGLREVVDYQASGTTSQVSPRARDDTARTLTISQADVIDGAIFSVSIGEKEYAVQIDSSDTADTVAKRLVSLLQVDYPNDDTGTRIALDANRISFTGTALLGLDDIGLAVVKPENANALTLSMLDDYGNRVSSQTIAIDGGVAAGDTAEAFFSDYGVSLKLQNIDQSVFDASAAFSSTKLSAAMEVKNFSDAGIFQIGSNVRDSTGLPALGDIRITGRNSSGLSYAPAFDKLYEAITAVGLDSIGPTDSDIDEKLEVAIDEVSTEVARLRSQMGAYINSLQFGISGLGNSVIELQAAQSNIADADYAAEMSRMVRQQIGQSSAAAMLAQANQLPNVILSLIS